MKILVMGLPGAGKTTLAKVLAEKLNAAYFNADEIRKQFNDWDFSPVARDRQASRMRSLCDLATTEYTVADFVCPTERTRNIFDADFVIYMNTIESSRFTDTNSMFEPPKYPDITISTWQNTEEVVNKILDTILQSAFKEQQPTGLMIGRFQPFHGGHLKLFETILEKQGQVCIAIRNTHGVDEKNPFNFQTVVNHINEALVKYKGKYKVMQLPNITGVYYGRDVGYVVEKIQLDEQTEQISATQIRAEMEI